MASKNEIGGIFNKIFTLGQFYTSRLDEDFWRLLNFCYERDTAQKLKTQQNTS